MNRHLGSLLVLAVLVGASGTARAQDPEWRLGGRASYMASATSSDELGATGRRLDLRSGGGLEIVAGVKISERFSTEFSVGAFAHRLSLTGNECCDVDGGRVWLVPLAAIARYHVPVYGHWDPYLGLGLTWIAPISKLSGDLSDAGLDELEFEGGTGLAAQAGLNYQLDNRWYVNLDLRYLGASLEARAATEGADLRPVNLDIKPFVIGLGCGYRF